MRMELILQQRSGFLLFDDSLYTLKACQRALLGHGYVFRQIYTKLLGYEDDRIMIEVPAKTSQITDYTSSTAK